MRIIKYIWILFQVVLVWVWLSIRLGLSVLKMFMFRIAKEFKNNDIPGGFLTYKRQDIHGL